MALDGSNVGAAGAGANAVTLDVGEVQLLLGTGEDDNYHY